MRLRTPEESLFSDNWDDLRARFAQADDAELGSLAMDLAQENNLLNRYISKTALTSWVEPIRTTAHDDLIAEGDTSYQADEDVMMS